MFFNHLQKKISDTIRVHGIGQGHRADGTKTWQAPDPDRPASAPVGYMSADMLDGYHAKEKYQEIAPSPESGLNADTLDGVHKSTGHFTGATSFANTTPVQAATMVLTFTGAPIDYDEFNLVLYRGVLPSVTLSSNLKLEVPTTGSLDVSIDKIVEAINTTASVKTVFDGILTADKQNLGAGQLRLTTTQKGAVTQGWALRATIKRKLDVPANPPLPANTTSTWALSGDTAVDLRGLERTWFGRFTTTTLPEGLDADKLDGVHGREFYHNATAGSPGYAAEAYMRGRDPGLVPGSGLNSDLLDGWHGRENYHGVWPPAGSGINADTLDGVHKLRGHVPNPVKGASNASVKVALLENLSENGKLTLAVYDHLGKPVAWDGAGNELSREFTGPTVDALGTSIQAALQGYTAGVPASRYIKVFAWDVSKNLLTFQPLIDASIEAEKYQFRLDFTVTDAGSKTDARGELLPLRIALDDQGQGPTHNASKFTDKLSVALSNSTVDPEKYLGVDADKLDGWHANQGHVRLPLASVQNMTFDGGPAAGQNNITGRATVTIKPSNTSLKSMPVTFSATSAGLATKAIFEGIKNDADVAALVTVTYNDDKTLTFTPKLRGEEYEISVSLDTQGTDNLGSFKVEGATSATKTATFSLSDYIQFVQNMIRSGLNADLLDGMQSRLPIQSVLLYPTDVPSYFRDDAGNLAEDYSDFKAYIPVADDKRNPRLHADVLEQDFTAVNNNAAKADDLFNEYRDGNSNPLPMGLQINNTNRSVKVKMAFEDGHLVMRRIYQDNSSNAGVEKKPRVLLVDSRGGELSFWYDRLNSTTPYFKAGRDGRLDMAQLKTDGTVGGSWYLAASPLDGVWEGGQSGKEAPNLPGVFYGNAVGLRGSGLNSRNRFLGIGADGGVWHWRWDGTAAWAETNIVDSMGKLVFASLSNLVNGKIPQSAIVPLDLSGYLTSETATAKAGGDGNAYVVGVNGSVLKATAAGGEADKAIELKSQVVYITSNPSSVLGNGHNVRVCCVSVNNLKETSWTISGGQGVSFDTVVGVLATSTNSTKWGGVQVDTQGWNVGWILGAGWHAGPCGTRGKNVFRTISDGDCPGVLTIFFYAS